jgi:DNA-binding NtrC family response regulator
MPIVAIIDETPEIRDLLRTALEEEGWSVITSSIPDSPYHPSALSFLSAEPSPDVVVYDIPLPYHAHWKALHQHILPSSGLAPQHWIITTTDPKTIDALIGPTNICTIIAKPFNLAAIVEAVTQCAEK